MRSKCELCGRFAETEVHHVYEGYRRQISDRYDEAKIRICRGCHQDIHQHPAHYQWLKKQTEERMLKVYGWSIDEFISVFGKNYI